MKARFLFPNSFKIIGWILTVPLILLGILLLYFEGRLKEEGYVSKIYIVLPKKYSDLITLGYNSYTDEVITFGLVLALILVAFSKTKSEDEYVSMVRLESLQWAIYVNYGLLILANLFIYEGEYFNAMVYNMFTPLLIFILRFHYVLFLKPKFSK